MSFGDAEQVFHIGPASCGVYGAPAGICEASRRWGTVPLEVLAAPAARLARDGVVMNAGQAYVAKILARRTSTPEVAALWRPAGGFCARASSSRNPELGESLMRLAEEGADPFYRGDVAARVCDWLGERGGSITPEDLSGYDAVEREPVRLSYRDREIHTNPPPSAGGTLLAYALALLDRAPPPPSLGAIVAAMAAAQSDAPAFVEGLAEEGFLERFLARHLGSTLAEEGFLERFLTRRLGSTTHVSVIDVDGCACSATCTNGEGSGVVVPGTGIHINNVMGEAA